MSSLNCSETPRHSARRSVPEQDDCSPSGSNSTCFASHTVGLRPWQQAVARPLPLLTLRTDDGVPLLPALGVAEDVDDQRCKLVSVEPGQLLASLRDENTGHQLHAPTPSTHPSKRPGYRDDDITTPWRGACACVARRTVECVSAAARLAWLRVEEYSGFTGRKGTTVVSVTRVLWFCVANHTADRRKSAQQSGPGQYPISCSLK